MEHLVWKVLPGSGMVSEPGAGLRLRVVPTMTPCSVRFVVEGHVARNRELTPLVSGYRDSVRGAMQAAEEAADRMRRF